jgi:plasmid stabilization system protein ParE
VKEAVFLSGAEADLQEIYAILEERGAGDSFLNGIDRRLELLRRFPSMAPAYVVEPLRKARVGRTPYGIFYSVEGARIMVIAIQDLRQDPGTLARLIRRRL